MFWGIADIRFGQTISQFTERSCRLGRFLNANSSAFAAAG